MGYYMRFLGIDKNIPSLTLIKSTLSVLDKHYQVIVSQIEETRGELLYQGTLLGEVEINTPDDDIFDEDIEELIDLVTGGGDANETKVVDMLSNATYMIAISALWEGKNADHTLSKLEPLWDWLFENHTGILQADNEGFYDQSGLILNSNLKI